MADSPFGSGGGGGSSSGGWSPPGGGGSSSKPKYEQQRRKPKKELIRGLARFMQTPQFNYQVRSNLQMVDPFIRGMRPKDIRAAAADSDIDPKIINALTVRAKQLREGPSGGFDLNPVALLPFAVEQANRPAQGVMSGLAEWSRQGEKNPVKLGPISLRLSNPFDPENMAEIGKAQAEGFLGKRHDTPTSIAVEAGRTRAKQGESTKTFGFLPGTDLEKGQALFGGKAGQVAYEMGGWIALDPLTYIGAGVGYRARQALKQTARVLGPEVAAAVRVSGPKVLSAAEKAQLTDKTLDALKGVRGGLTVRVPRPIKGLKGEGMLSAPHTVIPGRALGSEAVRRGFTRLEQMPRAGAPIRGFEDAFIPRAGARQLERQGVLRVGQTDEFETAAAVARGTAATGNTAIANATRHIAKQYRLSKKQAERVAYALASGPTAIDALPFKLRRAALQLRGQLDDFAAVARRYGWIPEEGATNLRGAAALDPDVRHAQDVLDRIEKRRYAQSGRVANAQGREHVLGQQAAARGQDAAGARAIEREAALELRSVADDVVDLNQQVRRQAVAARQAERAAKTQVGRLQRGLQNAAKELREVRRRLAGAATRDQRRTLQLQIRTLERDYQATNEMLARAVGDLEDAKAARRIADQMADAAKRVDAPGVPRQIAPTPVRRAGVETAAARRTAREQERLRVIDNVKASAEARLNKLLTRQDALARQPLGIPDESYFPQMPPVGRSSPTTYAGNPPILSRDPGFSKRRLFRGTDEMSGLEQRVLAGEPTELNPFAAVAKHGADVNTAAAQRRYTDTILGMTDAAGQPIAMRADDFVRRHGDEAVKAVEDGTSEYVKLRIGREGEFYTYKELAPAMKKVAQLSDPTTANKLLKFWDRWMTLWKGYATVPLPFGFGFHMRNGMGNVALNWAADISPADPAYAQAFVIQRKIARALREGTPIDQIDNLTDYQKALVNAALENDIIGAGTFHFTDIPQDTIRGVRSRATRAREALNPFDPNNLLIRSGRKFGSEIEENARLAHFIRKADEFGNFEDAAQSVRRYLFDYGDLTDIERNVFKRVIPFYTFTRKNTPVWITAAYQTPSKFSRMAQWRQTLVNAAGNPDAEVMPQYLEANAAFPSPVQLPFFPEGQTQILSPDLPQGAASETLQPVFENLQSLLQGEMPQATPWVEGLNQQIGGGPVGLAKALYETEIAEKDTFSGREFYPGQQEAVPFPLNLLPGWPERKVDDRLQPAIGARRLHVLNQLFPLLPKMQSWIPSDEAGEEKQARRLLSMLSGLQMYPLGPATKRSEYFRRVEEINQLLAWLRSKGYKVPTTANPTSSSGGWSPP